MAKTIGIEQKIIMAITEKIKTDIRFSQKTNTATDDMLLKLFSTDNKIQ